MSRLELILRLEQDLENEDPTIPDEDEDIDDIVCEDCGELIDDCVCDED